MRYIENARETLKLAECDGKFYNDEKYVHNASGTAYIGMFIALDYLFNLKNITKKRSVNHLNFIRII